MSPGGTRQGNLFEKVKYQLSVNAAITSKLISRYLSTHLPLHEENFMGRRTRIIFFTALMFCALNFLLPVIFQSSPAYAAIESNIVLGCPTDSSIKVSVLFTEDIPEEFKIGYGTDSGSGTTYAYTSEAIAASGVTPGIVTLSGLMGNTR